jgi:transposase-like protein
MKASHKLRSLGDVSQVIASASSVEAAAKRLGVNRSTVHRWCTAGKAPWPAGRQVPVVPAVTVSPDGWAQWVRETYELSPTEDQLVTLAGDALALARDVAVSVAMRVAAMGRFQALVKQLDLEAAVDGEAEKSTTAGSWPRRVG